MIVSFVRSRWLAVEAGDHVHNGDVKRRICLLVLGMHRSGTSALTRITSLLGADLPRVIMGPGRGNERGHWEPDRLVACHDRLLHKLGSQWNDWRRIDATMLPAAVLSDFKRELSDLIDADYPQSGLFVLKEPRLCRLVPFYHELLREKEIETRYLLAIRNPLAVVHSLSDRDGIPQARVALLWLRHVLDAEAATRNASRAIVSYEHVMNDWRPTMQRAAARLCLRWPRPLDEVASEIATFLAEEMQHFAPSQRELAARGDVPIWVQQTYRSLRDLETNPDDDGACDTLDKIRGAFDAASPMFADALQREIDTQRGALAAMRVETAAKATRIKKQESDLAGLRAELSKRDASIEALKGEITAQHEMLTVRDGMIKGLTAQVAVQREEIARLEAELARLRDRLGPVPLHAAAADGIR